MDKGTNKTRGRPTASWHKTLREDWAEMGITRNEVREVVTEGTSSPDASKEHDELN